MHIVIIGNGVSGVTAARNIRKMSDYQITIISEEHEYFYSRTALMYVYMGHMKFEHTEPYERSFWKKNKIDLVKAKVSKVDTENKTVVLSESFNISYDKLIIACGSKPNKFGWPGQDLIGVTGLYHKQDLEKIEKWSENCKNAVVVGGGLIGIELAEMLISRNIKVTFLVRESSFWNIVLPRNESEMINRHIVEHGIDLRLNTNLKEIIADENGRVKAILTDVGEVISCEMVGLTAGVSPNIDFLKDSGIKLGKGVKVNRHLETNIENVFAIGDCAEQYEPIGNRRQIEAVWYTGRMMGETVAFTICKQSMEYMPGNWFNSAKFLDIEYQTYGWVWAEPKEGERHFHWRHKKDNKCITICYEAATRKFLGINTFGIRMKHDFFDNALHQNYTVNEVINHLAKANFDPEFYLKHEHEILKSFYQSEI